MASRARLLQLQRQVSRAVFLHHRPQIHSSLFEGTTTCRHFLPSVPLISPDGAYWSWKRGFATKAETPNDYKEKKLKIGSDEFIQKFLLVASDDRNLSLKFTHRVCGTKSERVVCKQAYERGLVLVRCGGCYKAVVVADHLGFFHKPECLKSFVDAFEEQVKEGSDETMNFTVERPARSEVTTDPRWDMVELNQCDTTVVSVRKFSKYDTEPTKLPQIPLLVPSSDTSHSIKFTHMACGVEAEKAVCKKAYESGVVLVVCGGCDKVAKVFDRSKLFQNPKFLENFVSYCEKEMKKDVDHSMSFTVELSPYCEDPFDPNLHLVRINDNDAIVGFTHRCGALSAKKVRKEALDTGTVAIRCNGCDKLIITDYSGWFRHISELAKSGIEGTEETESARCIFEGFVALATEELLQGSEESLNFIFKDEEWVLKNVESAE